MRIFARSRATATATPERLAATMNEEIAVGERLYSEGLLLQAYADPQFEATFMILDAPSIEDARARFTAYPQVQQGLIEVEFTELVGLPAIASAHRESCTPLPAWWPEPRES